MATKAQRFREELLRARPKKPKKKVAKPKPKRFTHNDAHRADRKSTYAIEETRARPSRKSTRASSNHAKPDSALRITARNRNASPKARASRPSGNPI